MQNEVILTCAVTGAGDTTGKSAHVPVTPKDIAKAAIDAAKAGASIAHIHARDPKTGVGSRDPKLFKEIVDRVRDSDTDIVINITAGMGGDWISDASDPAQPGPGTDMIGPEERLAHIKECLPEICSLDCGTLNFSDTDMIYISTPPTLRKMAEMARDWGVKPELEVFELGHIRFAKALISEGLINDPPMFQLCLGIPWGAEQTVETMVAMKSQLPAGASWASFGIGRGQMPMMAAAVAAGSGWGDIVGILDALCDITYVSLGNGAMLHGLKGKVWKAYQEVQASNMSKSCETESEAKATVARRSEEKAIHAIMKK